jgi:hypothetical protein
MCKKYTKKGNYEKRYIYIDYDGVIRGTMSISYEMMQRQNIDLNDRKKVIEFYEKLDWNYLISISLELNRAYYYINKIISENKYNVSILTKINSLNEMSAKIFDIRKNSDVKTICVPNTIDKTDVVNPNGNILIDDFSGNLLNWKEKGGISVKFTDKEDERFVCTSSLDICLQDNLERKLIRKEC